MRHWSAQCPARCIWCGARLCRARRTTRSDRGAKPLAVQHRSCRSHDVRGLASAERALDAVVVANAFHWLDPDLRITKPSTLLRPGGRFAVLHTHHVRGGTPGFAEASQHCYLRSGLAVDLTFTLPLLTSSSGYPELEQVPTFVRVRRERFHIPTRYMTDEYVGLLRTDSLVNTLNPESRAQFLDDDYALLIDNSFGGLIERSHLYELVVATRR